MNFRNLNTAGLASGLAAAFILTTACNADAQKPAPVITFNHPEHVLMLPGSQRQRRVDCGEIVTLKKKFYASCKFYEQLDPNGQDFCNATDNDSPNTPVDDRIHAFSQAAVQSLVHAASLHKDCIRQAGSLSQRIGENPAIKYGSDWESKGSCSIQSALKMCMSEMGHEPSK